jgi:SAM-dependent methyltransferase
METSPPQSPPSSEESPRHYSIVDDPWPELARASASMFGGSRAATNLPVALEIESAYLFRDSAGREVHRYPIAAAQGISDLRHYIEYAARPPRLYNGGNSKSGLITAALMVARRLSLVRDRITVLEIGSTIGENYDLLRQALKSHDIALGIDFVGVDESANLTTFARLAHRRDPNFHAVTDDGSALDRFPDRAFDLVLCNGVANFVDDPAACFKGMARVCRAAIVLTVQLFDDGEPVWRTDAQTHKAFWLPPRRHLDALWRPFGPFHDYLLARFPFSTLVGDAGGTGFYLGDQAGTAPLLFERHILARAPLFPASSAAMRVIR